LVSWVYCDWEKCRAEDAQHAGAYTMMRINSHQAMMPGAPAYKPIVDNFGQFIVGPR
jgi:hypothetical protein